MRVIGRLRYRFDPFGPRFSSGRLTSTQVLIDGYIALAIKRNK